jgi:hypothetical protein
MDLFSDSYTGIDRRFGIGRRVEKSSIHIFLSYIFLLAKPEQENVGQENMDGSVLKSSVDGLTNDQNPLTHMPYEIWHIT